MSSLFFMNSKGTKVKYEILAEDEDGIIKCLDEKGRTCFFRKEDIDEVRWVRGSNRRMVMSRDEKLAEHLLKVDKLYMFCTNGYIYPVKVVDESILGFHIEYDNTQRIINNPIKGVYSKGTLIPKMIPSRYSDNSHQYAISLTIAIESLYNLGVEDIKYLNYNKGINY